MKLVPDLPLWVNKRPHLGLGKLAIRLFWEEETASSSLASETIKVNTIIPK